MTKLLQKAIEELKQLEALPEEEQDSRAQSILDYLRAWRERVGERADVEPYASFTFLQQAQLSLTPDTSVSYERELYGRQDALDA